MALLIALAYGKIALRAHTTVHIITEAIYPIRYHITLQIADWKINMAAFQKTLNPRPPLGHIQIRFFRFNSDGGAEAVTLNVI